MEDILCSLMLTIYTPSFKRAAFLNSFRIFIFRSKPGRVALDNMSYVMIWYLQAVKKTEVQAFIVIKSYLLKNYPALTMKPLKEILENGDSFRVQ